MPDASIRHTNDDKDVCDEDFASTFLSVDVLLVFEWVVHCGSAYDAEIHKLCAWLSMSECECAEGKEKEEVRARR